MASTYRSKLLFQLMPEMNVTFEVNTSSEPINPGDLVEVGILTRKAQLLEDDTVTADHKFFGISLSYWKSGMPMATEMNKIHICGFCVVEGTLASGTYTMGQALEYSASSDDGTLEDWDLGNQLIGWFWDPDKSNVASTTSARVLINVLDPSYGLLELSSA